MLQVDLFRNCDPRYHPSTVNAERYLFDLAHAISRSVPDVEVHARFSAMLGDEVVFRAQGNNAQAEDDDVLLF